jgi:pyrophosphatase PpaX
MTIRCILFDHDDTLLPTFAMRARALTTTMHELTGRDVDGAAIMEAANGRTLETMSGELAGGDEALARRIVAAYRERYYRDNRASLAPFAGIAELLQTLRENGTRVGVVTSKIHAGARDELEHAGLLGLVELVLGGDQVVERKPAAEPLEAAMRSLGAEPKETLMVGDTAADILGARAAGVGSAAAMWGVRDRNAMAALEPDFAPETPHDLLRIIGA